MLLCCMIWSQQTHIKPCKYLESIWKVILLENNVAFTWMPWQLVTKDRFCRNITSWQYNDATRNWLNWNMLAILVIYDIFEIMHVLTTIEEYADSRTDAADDNKTPAKRAGGYKMIFHLCYLDIWLLTYKTFEIFGRYRVTIIQLRQFCPTWPHYPESVCKSYLYFTSSWSFLVTYSV